jgi:hypothetical protein
VLCASTTRSLDYWERLKLGAGLTGWVARAALALHFARSLRRPRFAVHGSAGRYLRGVSVGSYLVRGRQAGVINVQHRDPHPHSEARWNARYGG